MTSRLLRQELVIRECHEIAEAGIGVALCGVVIFLGGLAAGGLTVPIIGSLVATGGGCVAVGAILARRRVTS